MAQPKAKMNIPMCAAAVLLCLTMFSFHFTGGLYAKYISRGSGADSARVAAFKVETTGNAGDGIAVDCYSATSDTFTITVKNESEVAVHYTITVTVENAYKDAVKVDYDANSTGDLAVGAAAVDSTITFSVTDWKKITAAETGNTASAAVGFTVTVDAVQID